MVQKRNAKSSSEEHESVPEKGSSKIKVAQLILVSIGIIFIIADLEGASKSVQKNMSMTSSVLTGSVTGELPGTIAQSVGTNDKQKGGLKDDKYTCVSFDENTVDDTSSHSINFDSLLNIRNGTAQAQVYVVMPAKAGGTTFKSFADECHPGPYSVDNFINRPNQHLKPFLLSELQPRQVVASHLYFADTVVDLIRWASRDSVIIFLYREETDRLVSGIKFMVKDRWCNDTRTPWLQVTNDGKCIMDEASLVHYIGRQPNEIGFSTHSLLPCPVWNEIQQTMPKMIFLHYSQSDTLQKKLATHYCPNLLPRLPLRVMPESSKLKEYIVNTTTAGSVGLTEWLKAKRNLLEYTIRLGGVECKREIRTVGDILRDPQQCPSRALLTR